MMINKMATVLAYIITVILGLVTVAASNKVWWDTSYQYPYVYDMQIKSIDTSISYLSQNPTDFVWVVDLVVERKKREDVICKEVREFLSIYSPRRMGTEMGRALRLREPLPGDMINLRFFYGPDELKSERPYIADFRSECLGPNNHVEGGQVAAPPFLFVTKCVYCEVGE